jgi:hypothetical protein
LSQGCAFWGSHQQKILFAGVIPKSSYFGAGTGISSLNVKSNNFRTARPNLVLRSQTMQLQMEFGCKGRNVKFDLLRVFNKKLQTGHSSQYTPLHNF